MPIPPSTCELRRVKTVQFGIFSPEETVPSADLGTRFRPTARLRASQAGRGFSVVFFWNEQRQMSVCKVEDPVPIVNGQFKKGGLYDPAMGQAMDTQTPCSTCGHPAPVCPGHFGHLVRHGIRLCDRRSISFAPCVKQTLFAGARQTDVSANHSATRHAHLALQV